MSAQNAPVRTARYFIAHQAKWYPGMPHRTAAVVTESSGQHYLEVRCKKSRCTGTALLPIPAETVLDWLQEERAFTPDAIAPSLWVPEAQGLVTRYNLRHQSVGSRHVLASIVTDREGQHYIEIMCKRGDCDHKDYLPVPATLVLDCLEAGVLSHLEGAAPG